MTVSSDRRRRPGAKGYRVCFDKTTERDAWYTARLLKQLSPIRRRQLRLLAEAFLVEDAIAASIGGPS